MSPIQYLDGFKNNIDSIDAIKLVRPIPSGKGHRLHNYYSQQDFFSIHNNTR